MPIMLDPEKGVDPMLSYCFYCQKEKNEIMLTGVRGKYIRRQAGASKNANGVCFNKEPCGECASLMQQGIILISTKDGVHNEGNPYRTGGWCVLTLKAAGRIFKDVDLDKNRVFFIEDKVYDAIGLPRNKNIDNRQKLKEQNV